MCRSKTEKHEVFMFAVLLLRVIEQTIKIIKPEFLQAI